MTPQDLAQAYAKTINGPANGWGQYIHPTLGVSHSIMRRLQAEVGNVEADRLIKAAMLEEAPMPWCDHCQCYHHSTARCINKVF